MTFVLRRVAAIVYLATATGMAWAGVSVDEARAVAQAYCPQPLAGVGATVEKARDGRSEYVFSVRDAHGAARLHRVSRETGAMGGWQSLEFPEARPGQAPLTEERAIEIARQQAEAMLGHRIASRLEWTSCGDPVHGTKIHPDGSYPARTGVWLFGRIPQQVEPPVPGLSVAQAKIAPDGTVATYLQRVPSAAELAPPPARVSRDEAVAVARAAAVASGSPDDIDTLATELFVHNERPAWSVTMGDASARLAGPAPRRCATVTVFVDAVSGRVTYRDRSSGATSPTGGSHTATRYALGGRPWGPAVASALLLVLTGTALVVRRRRRAA